MLNNSIETLIKNVHFNHPVLTHLLSFHFFLSTRLTVAPTLSPVFSAENHNRGSQQYSDDVTSFRLHGIIVYRRDEIKNDSYTT